MKKYTSLYEEIEAYETRNDKVVLGLTVLAVIIALGIIAWNPDVEAIGAWIYNVIF